MNPDFVGHVRACSALVRDDLGQTNNLAAKQPEKAKKGKQKKKKKNASSDE